MNAHSGSTKGPRFITPRPGAVIANAKGVPGSLGCFARTLHNQQAVLLTSWHVLYGQDAAENEDVYLVSDAGGSPRRDLLGYTLYGKAGIVHFDGQDYYVDCAVAAYLTAVQTRFYERNDRHAAAGIQTDIQPGELVTKTGAATGFTSGIVVDANYEAAAWINGRAHPAPRQLRVQSTHEQVPFAAAGDSGAVLHDEQGKAVGLVWGANSRGEGIACPIGPVLFAMNVSLERFN